MLLRIIAAGIGVVAGIVINHVLSKPSVTTPENHKQVQEIVNLLQDHQGQEIPSEEQLNELAEFAKIFPKLENRVQPDSFLQHQNKITPLLESETRFGPEFTFWGTESDANRWCNRIARECDDRGRQSDLMSCEVDIDFFYPACLVSYSDGWWYRVTVDPKVVEIKSRPQTVAEIETGLDRIQKDIFDFARIHVGILPHVWRGGGHIHIDIPSGFKNSPIAIRNFIVDLENHPAMFLGGISNSYGNSSLAIEPEENRTLFKNDLKEFDEKILLLPWNDTLKVLALKEVLNDEKRRPMNLKKIGNKHHLLHLGHVDLDGYYSIELRGLLPQKSAMEYLLLTQLFDGRLKYLRSNFSNSLIPYQDKVMDLTQATEVVDGYPQPKYYDEVIVALSGLTHGQMPYIIDPQASYDEFYEYVTEAGLNWNHFRSLLNPWLIELFPEVVVHPQIGNVPYPLASMSSLTPK